MDNNFHRNRLKKLFTNVLNKLHKKEQYALAWSIYMEGNPNFYRMGILSLENKLSLLNIPYEIINQFEGTNHELTEIYVSRAYLEQVKQIMLGNK